MKKSLKDLEAGNKFKIKNRGGWFYGTLQEVQGPLKARYRLELVYEKHSYGSKEDYREYTGGLTESLFIGMHEESTLSLDRNGYFYVSKHVSK